MIELKGLWKSFEDRDVLKDINAPFENGKRNLIIGKMGSGKREWGKLSSEYLTRTKWFRKNGTDEMYRRTTDAGTW